MTLLFIDQPVQEFSARFLLHPPPYWRVDWNRHVDTPHDRNRIHYGRLDVAGTHVVYEPENRIWRLTGKFRDGCCGDNGYEAKWPD